jgi:hypothetical protein
MNNGPRMRPEVFAALDGPVLRRAISDARDRETAMRRTVTYLADGWALCSGCGHSCTSSYDRQLCCTRCHLVVTPSLVSNLSVNHSPSFSRV